MSKTLPDGCCGYTDQDGECCTPPMSNAPDTRETVELKPCPFCGGAAERVTLDDPENFGGDVICCTKCQCSSHVEFGRKENLVDRWNSRATDADLAKLLHDIDATLQAHGRMDSNTPLHERLRDLRATLEDTYV